MNKNDEELINLVILKLETNPNKLNSKAKNIIQQCYEKIKSEDTRYEKPDRDMKQDFYKTINQIISRNQTDDYNLCILDMVLCYLKEREQIANSLKILMKNNPKAKIVFY